jgi:hypothetical protein
MRVPHLDYEPEDGHGPVLAQPRDLVLPFGSFCSRFEALDRNAPVNLRVCGTTAEDAGNCLPTALTARGTGQMLTVWTYAPSIHKRNLTALNVKYSNSERPEKEERT